MLINKREYKPLRFSSGELRILKSVLNSYIENNRVEILFENDFTIFELLLIIKYYKKQKVDVDLILPYLPYQRMDHTDRDELDTLNYVESIFNDLNLKSITIGEPHCDLDGLNNSKGISFVEILKQKLIKEIGFDENRDNVILTDKGGVERYKPIFRNAVYFNKKRDLKTGLIAKHEIVGGIKKNRRALIVDDIISSGDTIINVVECLKKLGVKEIYIISGHFENNTFNKRLSGYKEIKKIYSTNSLKRRGNKQIDLLNVRKIMY